MKTDEELPAEMVQSPDLDYRHTIGFGPGLLDIPKGFEDTKKYNGTLAHKMNHDFENNVNIRNVSIHVKKILNTYYLLKNCCLVTLVATFHIFLENTAFVYLFCNTDY